MLECGPDCFQVRGGLPPPAGVYCRRGVSAAARVAHHSSSNATLQSGVTGGILLTSHLLVDMIVFWFVGYENLGITGN